MLAAEGVPGPVVDEALTHLESAGLDAVEAAALPFARETVRYRAREIQERTVALRDRIGVVPTLEVVGVAALANMLCRASCLLGRP